MTPAVFLDRDGTMIYDVGYLRRVEEIRWFPWTIDAIRLLNRAGYLVCVTTNQSGIARGYYTERDLAVVHRAMDDTLGQAGARVDAWFHCPHHPDGTVAEFRRACECRKPGPGMIRQAEANFRIDTARSVVIGDKLLDVESGVAAGARGALVRTGYGAEVERAHGGQVPHAAFVADTLMEAVTWFLRTQGHPKGQA